jgi:hypothetical protein
MTFVHWTSGSGTGTVGFLRRARGSSNEPSDFAPVEERIENGTSRSFAPVGGCSSSVTALPFFNLEGELDVA